MKKIILTATMLFFLGLCNSQDLPNIVPPSPEVSALSKFTNVPVSHYTGMPSISVPIYTIQQNGISIPISLNYHARGVQLSEIAPRTGQGWSLQYGGSISRQVRGKADEASNGYLSQKNNFLNYSSSLAARQSVETMEQTYQSYDFYPDQFSFSAGSNSGKFILSYVDEQPIIQSFDDVKITYTIGSFYPGLNGITSFTLTDSKGIKYYYGVSKDNLRKAQGYQFSSGKSIYYNGNINNDSASSPTETVPSSWKLMDIELLNGDLISYFYENQKSGNSPSIYYTKSYDKHDPANASGSENGFTTMTNGLENIDDIFKIHSRISEVESHEKVLSKIEFNNGNSQIIFQKSNNLRNDFDGYALEKISILHNTNIVKSYKLNYAYTQSSDYTNMLTYFSGNQFTKFFYRMFLSSVEEEGNDGEKLPPYSFKYNDSEALPSMFSSRQDYWGYYNGASNNGPFTRPFEYGNYVPNRRVDTVKSEIGILKEIEYPTGGKSKFTYEHNRGTVPNEFDNLLIPPVNPGSSNAITLTLEKSDFIYDPITGYADYPIQMPAGTEINYYFDCFHLTNINDPNSGIIPDCIFEMRVNGLPINSNQNVGMYTPTDPLIGTVTTNIGIFAPRFPGVDPNLHRARNYNFQITITYTIPDDRSNLYGAGKRIKKIETVDEFGNSTFKEYEYIFSVHQNNGGLVLPSGEIIGLPAYISGRTSPTSNIYTNYNDATSAYSNFQPNSIGYSGVIEYQGTKENNIGKVEYTFTNIGDSGGDYYEFPYHPPADNEWLRGKNVRTEYFSVNEIGQYDLEKEIYNKYLYGDIEYPGDFNSGLVPVNFVFTPPAIYETNIGNNVTSTPNYQIEDEFFKLAFFMRERIPYNNTNPNYVPGYRIYYATGGTQHLLSTTETSYNDAGTVETSTTYNYDYDNHYQLAEQEVTNSLGDVLKTKYHYPSSTNNAILFNANRIVPPLKTETFKDNAIQSTTSTIYSTFSGNYLPEKIQTSKGTQSLEDRIVYHEYDNKGNPVEVSKKDGTKIYYVWGYNQTQPIAKIEGYTDVQLSNITSLINSAITASNNDSDTCVDYYPITCNERGLRVALQAIRDNSNMSNAQVTTFTYDPLIGVTSITDPRGQTIYYEYDNFNRLEYVKDNEGNILSKNQYNYKN